MPRMKRTTTPAACLSLLTVLLLSACAKTPVVAPPVESGPGSGSGTATATATGTGAIDGGKLSYPQVLVMALNGNHVAEFELGAMLHDGDGVDRDYAKALEWYEKAATAGNRQAMFNIGLMEKNGEGGEQDLAKARTWFVRASDAGDVRGTFQLAQMSYFGQATAQDYAKAFSYYTKAAMAGLPEAQMNVGVMNVRGEGMAKQDSVEAYAWLQVAKDSGNERAVSLVDSLAAQLTDEQKKTGEERAAALKAEIKMKAGPNARL
ncbi:sel1 repeat family protein [Candidatus Peribacteria bacterium]|nr:sel1 repeat family protein [Candidatus Peribacteria bacterium]